MSYSGVPNKKRKVVVDTSGHVMPIDKRSGAGHYFMTAASGTLLAAGHLTVSGSQFKTDSIGYASYAATTSGSIPIGVEMGDGTATFRGDPGWQFYYMVVNRTF